MHKPYYLLNLKGSETQVPHLLIHPPITHNSQVRAKPNSAAQNSILVSHMGDRLKYLSHHHLLPHCMHMSRKSDWAWNPGTPS